MPNPVASRDHARRSDTRPWLVFMLTVTAAGVSIPLRAAVEGSESVAINVTERGLSSLIWRGVEYAAPEGLGQAGFVGEMSRASLPEGFAAEPTSRTRNGTAIQFGYPWGTVRLTYTGIQGDLNVSVELHNTSEKPLPWWRLNALQLNDRLQFDPTGRTMHWTYRKDRFGGGEDAYDHWNFADPHVYWWHDRDVKILFVDLDGRAINATGVWRRRTDKGDRWVVTLGLDGDEQHPAVPPGQSVRVSAAIRFRTVWDSHLEAAADGYEAWGRANPRQVHWTDRRPIGTFFVAEAAKGWARNPNGWFNDSSVDVTSEEGRESFAHRLLERVDASIAILKEVDAQGVIWWDVEGARYPHPITYIGDPRVLDPKHPDHARYAPEMNHPVSYSGRTMPLVDACMAKFRDAGLVVGVTVRPQELRWAGQAPEQRWVNTPNEQVLPKVEYARQRWGCRIFYIDSVADWYAVWWYDAAVRKFPDVLMMPEWARTRTFVNSAPFSHTQFTGWHRGTPPEVHACWPDAFVGMSHFSLDTAEARENVLHAVQQGDVLLFNCWFRSPLIEKMKAICALAGIRRTPIAKDQSVMVLKDQPVEITLQATDEDGETVAFRLLGPPEHGHLRAFDAATGRVIYQPEPGYAGKDIFTFAARDSSGLSSARASVRLQVLNSPDEIKSAEDEMLLLP